MKVGDSAAWSSSGKSFPEQVTVLWLPTTEKAKYGEPLALVEYRGEPKLVPLRVLNPPPGPCRAAVTLNLCSLPVRCKHTEGHRPDVHEASVGSDPLIYISWRSVNVERT
jgi:hypothetical protein